LGLPGVWLTLARRGGEPAGFALSRVILDESELLLLGVRPQFRRRGIGRALLSHWMESARARGAVRVHLEVRDGNGALDLYLQAGFTRIGRRGGYYRGADGRLHDALTLARPLAL
jgi:ribosomal-protein-alanine N-acetyltransferase